MRRIFLPAAVTATAVIVAGSVGITARAEDPAPEAPIDIAPFAAQGLNPVSNNDRVAVAQDYRQSFLATKAVPMTWQGAAPSGCQPGTPSKAVLNAHVTQINFYRRLAGLSPVTNNVGLNADAQAAALVFAKAQKISHNPPSNWPCMSQAASRGAGSSNIGLGDPMDSSAYIIDDNVSSLGHRRWLMLPSLGQVGLGVYQDKNARGWGGTTQRVIHNSRAKTFNNPGGVAWPAAGWFPAPLAGQIWSYQPAEGSRVDISRAQVTMTDGKGKRIATNAYFPGSGYGVDTLAWTPRINSKRFKGNVSETYTVTISNVVSAGRATTVSYKVTLFDPTSVPAGKPKPTPKPAPTPVASVLGDQNGDTLADVVGIDEHGELHSWVNQNGTALAAGPAGWGSWAGFRWVVAAPDVGGDGHSDVYAMADDGAVWYYQGAGNGTYGSPRQVAKGWDAGLDVATVVPDLDGNGLPELLVRHKDEGRLMRYPVTARDGSLGQGVQIGRGWNTVKQLVGFSDLSGDSVADLIAVTTDGCAYLYTMSRAGQTVSRSDLAVAVRDMTWLFSPGDVNGDGRRDLLGRRGDGALVLFPAQADGTFGQGSEIARDMGGMRILF